MARNIPTVELSIAATSEELEILAAAAQRKQMTLKDFLRLQLVAAAKAAVRLGAESPPPKTPKAAQNQASAHPECAPKPVFLP